MTTRPDWVCGTCNGYGSFPDEAPPGSGLDCIEVRCPAPHAGPFVVDGRELWADPEKVVWRCAQYDQFERDRPFWCDVRKHPDHGTKCGFYPIGVRLEQVKETP